MLTEYNVKIKAIQYTGDNIEDIKYIVNPDNVDLDEDDGRYTIWLDHVRVNAYLDINDYVVVHKGVISIIDADNFEHYYTEKKVVNVEKIN